MCASLYVFLFFFFCASRCTYLFAHRVCLALFSTFFFSRFARYCICGIYNLFFVAFRAVCISFVFMRFARYCICGICRVCGLLMMVSISVCASCALRFTVALRAFFICYILFCFIARRVCFVVNQCLRIMCASLY